MAKLTATSPFTPILTDIMYGVDDPGGTPISGKHTYQVLLDLLQPNLSIAATQLTGTLADARVAASNVTQHQAALSIAATQLTGTLADARVAATNVTQHQAALSIAATQLTGTLADARVAASNVTQHDAALAGKGDTSIDASYLLPEEGASGPVIAVVQGTNVDYEELLYDGGATETAFFKYRAPRGSNESATIDFVLEYAPKGTSSGNVRWEISALAIGDGDTIDATFGTAVTDDSAAGAVANVAQRSGTLAVAPNGTWAAGDSILVKVSRLGGHANDTNTDDVGLLNILMALTYNSLKDA